MIAIVGATGYTGKLVAAELIRRKVPFVVCGRSERALQLLTESLGAGGNIAVADRSVVDGGVEYRRIDYRVVDAQDESTFKALDDCKVIINCAGPFTDLGEPIVKAAIARGAHYLDTTGEQGFIKLVYDKYHEQAKARGIALVPACAFEYAIGDAMGAQLCSDSPECRAIDLVYSIGEMHTSPGTRKSIVRAVTAPGFLFKDGKFVDSKPAALVSQAQLDGRVVSIMSFPAGEVLMLSRHTKVQNVTTYMTSEAPPVVLRLVAGLGQFVVSALADFLVGRVSAAVPSSDQRKSSTFLIRATGTVGASSVDASSPSITVTGSDPYLLTALIIGEAATHLMNNSPSEVGAITPTMVLGSEAIRKLLEESGAGVKWVSAD